MPPYILRTWQAATGCKIYYLFVFAALSLPNIFFHVGRVEVRVETSGRWAPICGDGWGVREGMVSAQYYGYI